MKAFLSTKFAITLISFICLLSFTLEKDVNMTAGKFNVRILGHSGKIEISVNGTNSSDNFVVNFDSLVERDSNGTEVGNNGSVKHSFNNFAQLDFDISDAVPAKYQNITAYTLVFEASKLVDANTTFTGLLYIFNESGTINFGNNETAQVSQGTVKFSIHIANWPFCKSNDTCAGSSCCLKGQSNEVGSFLDLSLKVNYKNNATADANSTKLIKFGESKMILTSAVISDGKSSQMAKGYPTFYQNGNSNLITLRFTNFTSDLVWDPVISVSSSGLLSYGIYALFSILSLFILS